MGIIVNMACGLANRMFQYSYYLYLRKKGLNVTADFYNRAALAHESVEWNKIFPKAQYLQASKKKIFFYGGGTDILSRSFRRFLPFLTRVQQMPTAFDADLPLKNNRYVMGVFQNASMVESIKDVILKTFEFQPFNDDYNIRLAQEMQGCTSVAIHVRKRKDYTENKWFKDTCPFLYYQKAIEIMQQKLVNPHFYIFTDNPEWVNEHFTSYDFTLVEGNPTSGWGSHFDMQLMSCCKHNIISNSTYSWWGAFLNRNNEKIVIGPKQWFNPKSCAESTSERTLCKDWIAI